MGEKKLKIKSIVMNQQPSNFNEESTNNSRTITDQHNENLSSTSSVPTQQNSQNESTERHPQEQQRQQRRSRTRSRQRARSQNRNNLNHQTGETEQAQDQDMFYGFRDIITQVMDRVCIGGSIHFDLYFHSQDLIENANDDVSFHDSDQ